MIGDFQREFFWNKELECGEYKISRQIRQQKSGVQQKLRRKGVSMRLAAGLVFLLILAGCGNPSQKTPTQNPPPPPNNIPSMAGTWIGVLTFTGTSGNVSLAISQDVNGNLTGQVSSTPPICSFTSQITGQIFENRQFGFNSVDTLEGFNGTLSGDGKTVSGNVNLMQGTGCGPRSGAWSATKQ